MGRLKCRAGKYRTENAGLENAGTIQGWKMRTEKCGTNSTA